MVEKEQAENEENMPLCENKFKAQLEVPLVEQLSDVPQDPKKGDEKERRRKNFYWFSNKENLAAGTYLQILFSSGS
ncbi:hypothetical protein NSQ77_11820 [Oceanobacillus sp. FSL K6-2867]|uniref:hypothetical protein n=1 Tax=Oceanobacillus sp. FSL K6-2867 TaxID=2954748 RepID=UPI0030DC7528